jgi:hypothetical protein
MYNASPLALGSCWALIPTLFKVKYLLPPGTW